MSEGGGKKLKAGKKRSNTCKTVKDTGILTTGLVVKKERLQLEAKEEKWLSKFQKQHTAVR